MRNFLAFPFKLIELILSVLLTAIKTISDGVAGPKE